MFASARVGSSDLLSLTKNPGSLDLTNGGGGLSSPLQLGCAGLFYISTLLSTTRLVLLFHL
jgi:hypothetical protein